MMIHKMRKFYLIIPFTLIVYLQLSYCQVLSILDEMDWTEDYDEIYKIAIDDGLKILANESSSDKLVFTANFKNHKIGYFFHFDPDTELIEMIGLGVINSKEKKRIIKKHNYDFKLAFREMMSKYTIDKIYGMYVNILIEFGGNITESYVRGYAEKMEFDLNEAINIEAEDAEKYFENFQNQYYKNRGLEEFEYLGVWGIFVELNNLGIIMDTSLESGQRGHYFDIEIYKKDGTYDN